MHAGRRASGADRLRPVVEVAVLLLVVALELRHALDFRLERVEELVALLLVAAAEAVGELGLWHARQELAVHGRGDVVRKGGESAALHLGEPLAYLLSHPVLGVRRRRRRHVVGRPPDVRARLFGEAVELAHGGHRAQRVHRVLRIRAAGGDRGEDGDKGARVREGVGEDARERGRAVGHVHRRARRAGAPGLFLHGSDGAEALLERVQRRIDLRALSAAVGGVLGGVFLALGACAVHKHELAIDGAGQLPLETGRRDAGERFAPSRRAGCGRRGAPIGARTAGRRGALGGGPR
mmetsp:Transcript_3102/g.9126  ORF Transcript_3102/g.9126 Transcript_3102/m.9126 type:complete len:294 (-) Transcript_3102:54-935(-)